MASGMTIQQAHRKYMRQYGGHGGYLRQFSDGTSSSQCLMSASQNT